MTFAKLTTVAAAALLISTAAIAQAPDSAKMVEMMQQAMELAQPGPEHKMLEQMVGKFNYEVKATPAPGQPSITATGTGENEMVLGGRFLQMKTVGEIYGSTMEGINMLGFDRRHGKFTIVGFDNHGTYYITGAGGYDEATKTITMSGTDDEPTFGHTQIYDLTYTLVDPDTYIGRVIFKNPEITQGKGDFTMVEFTARRQK